MKLTRDQRRYFRALLFPALIENLLSQIFLLIDSIMVGQMENSTPAVAAFSSEPPRPLPGTGAQTRWRKPVPPSGNP